MTQDSSTYWKKARTEVRAAGFDPDRAAQTNAVVTIASAYTNAHRCNNRVRQITDLLVELIGERGGTGLIVGAPAVSDALTQGHARPRATAWCRATSPPTASRSATTPIMATP
jgi:dihydroxy-acid dehydratase